MNGILQNFIIYIKHIFAGLRQLKNFRLSYLWKVFSLMGKREKITAAILTLTAILSFYSSARIFYFNHTTPVPDSGGTYIEGMLGQPAYINPLLAHQETDIALMHLVFSGLYKYDENGQIIPDLAENLPQISEDQKQYLINLKKNARWHKDMPVTADDVVFTFNTLKDPNYKSPLRNFWLSTNVEKISDYSVRFTTKDISAPFLQNLTLPIIPKFIWSRVEPQNFLLSKTNLESIGSGPYAIKEIKKLPSGKVQEITLESFNDFHLTKPKINRLIIKFFDKDQDLQNALQSKEIMGFGFSPLINNLLLDKNQKNLQFFSLPLPQYQVLFLNLKNNILADVSIRKALALAIDRQQIIEQVFNNQANLPGQPLLFNKPGDFPQANKANLNQAAELLVSSGYKLNSQTNFLQNKKGQILELSLATNDTLLNNKAAELVAAQWQKLGIKIKLISLPTKDLADKVIKPRNFDILLFPQKFGADPDPFLFFHSSQISEPGMNLTGFSDQTVDSLITEARTTTNKTSELEKYKQLTDIINQKIPVIYLDQTVFEYVVNDKIKNIKINTLYEANQRFYDAPNWYSEYKRVWK